MNKKQFYFVFGIFLVMEMMLFIVEQATDLAVLKILLFVILLGYYLFLIGLYFDSKKKEIKN